MSSRLSVQMNARASADPEGNPLSFSWEFSDGDSSNGSDRLNKLSPNGGMLATLTVLDGKLGDTVQVYTHARCDGFWDVAPQPQFTATVSGNTVALDASASTLADSLNWDFGDGTTGSGMFTSHTYASPGTYTVQLRANGGMMGGTKSATVVVGGTTNQPPIGDFTTAVNGATVHIQSVGVSDADGDKVSYLLDFGDGKSVKYPSAWHTYKTPGVYTITQTLNDGKVSTVKTHEVTVSSAGTNRAPVAVFSYYSSDLRVGVKGGASADFEGNPLTYVWDFGNGTLPGTDIQQHTVTVPEGGTFVTLTVFDGELGDTVQIQVPARAGQHWDVRPDAIFTAKVAGKNVAVDASASKLVDSFSWDFGDGTKGTGMYASHTYATPGNYVVKLNTNGGMMGNSNSTTVVIG
ncbi:MAG: PKD domain-containing protein, partial [Sphingobacteriales bacterium]